MTLSGSVGQFVVKLSVVCTGLWVCLSCDSEAPSGLYLTLGLSVW